MKYHKEPLDIIANLKKVQPGRLISNNRLFEERDVHFELGKRSASIEFNADNLVGGERNVDVGRFHEYIQIELDNSIYDLERVFVKRYAPPKVSCVIDNMNTIGFKKTDVYFYQVIIPLERELVFHYNIEQSSFTTDIGYTSRTGTIANIETEFLQVCCIDNRHKEYFLVIDSPVMQTYEDFTSKVDAIVIGMAYLSGYFAGNQGFYFAYNEYEKRNHAHFRCVQFRDSIISSYQPVYSNIHAFENVSNKEQYANLRPVSIKEFSFLCDKIYHSRDFASMLMLMLESSVASLLFMPGGYAIALETLSDLIIGDTKLNLPPIKDKTLGGVIRDKLLEVIELHRADISDLETVTKRIEALNQPTNRARLKAPFELLKIELNKDDLKVLDTRNDFLHGRVPDLTKEGKVRSRNRINKDLYYSSIRLYTLLNLVILKWINYDNRIVNHPKLYEGYTEILLDEEYFRQV